VCGGGATLGDVDEKKVMTAAKLEQLPLEERQRIAAEAIVTDVSQVPTEFLDRARQRGRELLEERGVVLPPSA
jgi:shikimate 5-dehydrogenase